MNHERICSNVAVVGGLGDSEASLHKLTTPLFAPHRRIFCLSGNWQDPEENELAKTARVRDELAQIAKEHGPLTVVGISAGGLLAMANHDVDGVQGIVTAASPLHAPKKWTIMLELARRMYPQLPPLVARVVENIIPKLPEELPNINFRGTRDGRVPPEMSIVNGSDNRVLQTPRRVIASHKYNVKNALRSLAATAGVGR